jgi:hypothetical protein
MRMANNLGIVQKQISEIEQHTDMHTSTLRRADEAIGGSLSLVAQFPDRAPGHTHAASRSISFKQCLAKHFSRHLRCFQKWTLFFTCRIRAENQFNGENHADGEHVLSVTYRFHEGSYFSSPTTHPNKPLVVIRLAYARVHSGSQPYWMDPVSTSATTKSFAVLRFSGTPCVYTFSLVRMSACRKSS